MTYSLTLDDIVACYGVWVEPHLDCSAVVPVHDGLQVQGDVAVVPIPRAPRKGTSAAPPFLGPTAEVSGGTCVVALTTHRRRVGAARPHHLLAAGPVQYASVEPNSVSTVLGILTVPTGSTAFLAHAAHPCLGIGPGIYELRRQLEFPENLFI